MTSKQQLSTNRKPHAATGSSNPRLSKQVLIRQARVSDAQALIDHAGAVATESDNLTFGPGEFEITLDQQKRFLESLKGSTSALYLVATIDQKITGTLTLHRGKRPRVAHEAEFGMSVRRYAWGQGIGSRLMKRMIRWCQQNGITKINLRVRTDHQRAIRLYLRHGFEFEGRNRRSLLIDGSYHDTYSMGLCL